MMTIRQFYLLKLSEECAEVAQRAAKQMQFGADERQANGPSTTKIAVRNAERLRNEINDLMVLVGILEDYGEIPRVLSFEWTPICAAKYAELAKYLAYSQELGLVESL